MIDGAMEKGMADATAALGVGGESMDNQGEGGAEEDVDDLVSQMAIETYIACRVRPLTSYLEKRALLMSRRNQFLEFAVIVTNTSGAVLAVLSLADWIACTVAISSQCMALIDYFYIPAQLAATNKALEDCHNLLSFWDSLSLVQRKTRAVKKQCCLTVEGAMLDLCSSRTAVSSALPSDQPREEPEE